MDSRSILWLCRSQYLLSGHRIQIQSPSFRIASHRIFHPFPITAGYAVKVDIRADTNRDGVVDIIGNSDCAGKANWTKERGAMFLPNIGDTHRRCSKIVLQQKLSNEELGNCHDASDDIQRAPQYLAPLRTVPISDASDTATATISVPNTSQQSFVRIFRHHKGKWTIVHENHIFFGLDLRQGLTLGIDARDTRRPDVWDGRVAVRFKVQDDNETSTDDVELRVAPILVHNHLDKVQQIWSTAGNNTHFPWQHSFTRNPDAAVQ